MDKRDHIRTSLQGDVGLLGINLSIGSETQVVDLSASGACIVTTRPLELGKRVSFSLNLTDAEEDISFIAEVKWMKPAEDNRYKVGLQFVK